jgi:hypothetical protein
MNVSVCQFKTPAAVARATGTVALPILPKSEMRPRKRALAEKTLNLKPQSLDSRHL